MKNENPQLIQIITEENISIEPTSLDTHIHTHTLSHNLHTHTTTNVTIINQTDTLAHRGWIYTHHSAILIRQLPW